MNQTTKVTQNIDLANVAARAESASKIYGSGESEVRALDNVSVSFERGKFSAIMGPSGSGKSTLMHCIAGLDALTSGSVYIGETDLSKLSDKEITKLRREKIGFIFQSFNLIPTLNAYENITLPMSLGKSKGDKAWIQQVIDTISLNDRLDHRPSELSGGQQQRVAVARALATRPEIIFADEPTGNLDADTGQQIIDLMFNLARDHKTTLMLITHDADLARACDRTVEMRDGRLVKDAALKAAE